MLVGDIAGSPISDYEGVASLVRAAELLRSEAQRARAALQGRRVWMVNSTARGGGVAELLPPQVTLLRSLGIETYWVVIEAEDPAFFRLTKQIHNLIHGVGRADLTAADRAVYEAVNRQNADALADKLCDGDILVVHDPQPMALAGLLRKHVDVRTIWRCHIGLDEESRAADAAWEFLRPYADAYERGVFSAPEYVPGYFADRAEVIYPSIDPLSPKNRELHVHKLVGVLANAALANAPAPVVRLPFPWRAERLQRDGTFGPATLPDDIGLLARPIITQVSRWDRLKGFLPLLHAFAALKEGLWDGRDRPRPLERRRLALVRLVLAGPDPASIQDDPEGLEVLEELGAAYAGLDPMVQDDVALVTLPMQHPEQNALMVNALQRASSIIVQNSLREGFGLTVAEAMWKHLPVLTNARACGPRQQIRDDVDGRLARNPEDVAELADLLREMLLATDRRQEWGRSAQRRVHDEFLVLSELARWLPLFAALVSDGPPAS
jgi:trehalose synthase